MANIFCINCKKEIPEIKKVIAKTNKQVLSKVCLTCKPQASRQSLRPFNPKRK